MKKEFNFDNRKFILSYNIEDGNYIDISLDFIGYVEESEFKIITLDGSNPILNSYEIHQIEVDDKIYFITDIDGILYLINQDLEEIIPVKIYDVAGYNFHLSTENMNNIFSLFLSIPDDENEFDYCMEIIYSINRGVIYTIIKEDEKFKLYDSRDKVIEVSEKIFHIKDEVFVVRVDDYDFCTAYKNDGYDTLFYYSEIKYLCNDKFICKNYNNKYGIMDIKDNIVVDFIYDKIEVVDDKVVFIKKEEINLNKF